MDWHTNLLENPYHPINFDGHGHHEDPVTATYSATFPDYESDKSSYIGGKPTADVPPPFDVCNYTDPKTKEFSYWYHTKLDKRPPAGLVDLHVAKIYCLELKFLDDKIKKQILCCQDSKKSEFLHGMIQAYRNQTSSDEPDIFDTNQDQKHILNQLIRNC